jgi:hypothetical protein
MILGAILVLLVLALALGSSDKPPTQFRDVNARQESVVTSLASNDLEAFYDTLSPTTQDAFPFDSFSEAQRILQASDGNVLNIEVLEPPQILSGAEWQGEWAESKIRIIREKTSKTFVVRYHLENGQWWLFGTIPTSN